MLGNITGFFNFLSLLGMLAATIPVYRGIKKLVRIDFDYATDKRTVKNVEYIKLQDGEDLALTIKGNIFRAPLRGLSKTDLDKLLFVLDNLEEFPEVRELRKAVSRRRLLTLDQPENSGLVANLNETFTDHERHFWQIWAVCLGSAYFALLFFAITAYMPQFTFVGHFLAGTAMFFVTTTFMIYVSIYIALMFGISLLGKVAFLSETLLAVAALAIAGLFANNRLKKDKVLQGENPTFTSLWFESLAADSKRVNAASLAAGDFLLNGKYQIISKHIAGGQGLTYLAETFPQRITVLIKEFILPSIRETEARRIATERFEAEARLLQSLDNPHIVKLREVFIEDHRCYQVSDYVSGEDLRRTVESYGRFTSIKCLSLASQMCAMLGYLHGLTPPVVHSDFTPDNLVLGADGNLTLVDFATATIPGQMQVAGKTGYMPPEQLRGSLCPASDIYAMGCTLYYLATGLEPEPLSRQHIYNDEELKSVGQKESRLHNLISAATSLQLESRADLATLDALLREAHDI